MTDDLSTAQAQQTVERLFGPGCAMEARNGGFIVLRMPPSEPSGAPAGLAPPTLEIIGQGRTRREAIESARQAVEPSVST